MKIRVNPAAGVDAVQIDEDTLVTLDLTEVTKAQYEVVKEMSRSGVPLVLKEGEVPERAVPVEVPSEAAAGTGVQGQPDKGSE